MTEHDGGSSSPVRDDRLSSQSRASAGTLINAIVVSSEHLLAEAIGRLTREALGVAAIVLDELPPTTAAIADLLLLDEHVYGEHLDRLDDVVAPGAKLLVFGGTSAERPRGTAATPVAAYFTRLAREEEVRAGLIAVTEDARTTSTRSRMPPPKTDTVFDLTSRERAIVRHIARGATTAEIAGELFVSPSTIKTQLRALYRKLGVKSRAEAVFFLARNEGLELLL
jgi:DNA-binding CsgD family transcriptional regulator